MSEIIALEVKFEFANSINAIHPAIIRDDKEMILVDCGYPGFVPIIKEAAEKRGCSLDNLTKIVITHHDYDHMGALAEFKAAYPNISIAATEIEERYISGKEKSLRLQQAEAIHDSLPEHEKPAAESFQNKLKSIKPVPVDILLRDKEKLSCCGGVEVITTPGHMPGHLCLYHLESKTLVAGDALVVNGDELGIANPRYTLDMEEAKRSIKKLLDYDIQAVICYHGGLFTGDVRTALEKML
jgi:glyoxylase-like metal-dependent hydrolase (beta-lactamase superfamily II)